jgi:hypothetical protein
MAAGGLPILVYKVNTSNGAFARMERLAENAGETALNGVPVLLTSGYVGESPTINDGTDFILGFSTEPFSNLSSDGVAKTLTYGHVQNQPDAVNIPIGAPINDGTIGVEIATDNVEFIGMLATTGPASVALAQADIGAVYGLTKNATTGYWFVDKAITTIAGGACVRVTGLADPIGTVDGRVSFTVLSERQQFSAAD